jgi:cyclin-dependent kinase regulatory subunit CKS1
MPHYPDEIEYSEKYCDSLYEYRHVILPKDLFKKITKGKLLSENEWRALGVQQSRGWSHYDIHKPEPHILLFRRPLGTDPQTGLVPNDILLKIQSLESSLNQFSEGQIQK